jgi:hypothetical protein
LKWITLEQKMISDLLIVFASRRHIAYAIVVGSYFLSYHILSKKSSSFIS